MLRRPYKTKARFFVGDPTEVTVRWYPCKADAPFLEFPTSINSLDWHATPWLVSGVGEVPDRPRPFAAGRAIPRATGEHVCGTEEEFSLGEVLDPTKPPTMYADDGLPVCCGEPLKPAVKGGGVGGGSPTATVRPITPGFCTAYHYVDPDVGATVTLLQINPERWRCVFPGPALGDMVTFPSGAEWTFDRTVPFFRRFTTTNWNGSGSRVFVGDEFNITMTCGLPPP